MSKVSRGKRGRKKRIWPGREDPVVLRDRSKLKTNNNFGLANVATTPCVEDDLLDTPLTFKQAMSSPFKNEWYEAMQEELRNMESLNVWTLTKLPAGKRSLGCRWVFKAKRDSTGKIERYRARLVPKGYMQKF